MRWSVPVLLFLLAAPALALEPYLVKDINPFPQPGSSQPGGFVTLGGVALFAAGDDRMERELWRSDGTAAGTWQVADSCEIEGCSGNPQPFALTDRLSFFTATVDLAGRRRLWVTDGTPNGTFDLDVRAEGSGLWVPAQRVLYFSGWDQEHGSELWRSDGTPLGTYRVSDLHPGAPGSSPTSLTLFKDRIYFGGVGPKGGALWRSDGTAKGTELVKELGKSSPSFSPGSLRPFFLHTLGKRLVFAADAGLGHQDLWASDGTAKGTAPLTRWTRGTPYSRVFAFVAQGSKSYIVADDGRNGQELWITDGTVKGTRALTSFARKEAFYLDLMIAPFDLLPPTLTGGRLVFGAHDGPHGVELWVTDGTPKGTGMLKDICPGECLGLGRVWLTHKGLLYFLGNDGVRGWELWVTNGTAAGTRLVRDLCPGSCDGSPSNLHVLGDRLIFRADGPTGGQVWRTDGTEAGTFSISAFSPGLDWGFFQGTILRGKILFGAPDDAHGYELWSTNGTAAGTRLVRDVNDKDLGGSFPTGLRALGDVALFLADDGVHGIELWKSDGTEPGTELFAELVPGEQSTPQPQLGASEVAGGNLFFIQNALLWRTDGTGAGTFPVTDGSVSFCCSEPVLRAFGGNLFFAARGDEYGLWMSDGTVQGTRQVGDTEGNEVHELVEFQGKLFFTVEVGSFWELWRSDGTDAGTIRVQELGLFPPFAMPWLTVHGGRLWFFANDGENGTELWSSDGTSEGAAMAVELAPGPDSFQASTMTSFGAKLIISPAYGSPGGLWATDGTPAGTEEIGPKELGPSRIPTVFQGRLYLVGPGTATDQGVLWTTDGTAEGTAPLKDRDGSEVPVSYDFAPLGSRLLFITQDGSLWQTDGTAAGTVRLLELGHGASWELVQAGSRVFFPAFDPATGLELWAVVEE